MDRCGGAIQRFRGAVRGCALSLKQRRAVAHANASS